MLEPRGLTPAERGRRMSDALNRLGPSYIKLGQFLATRPDIVGAEMADALSALKDDLPPFPTEEARDDRRGVDRTSRSKPSSRASPIPSPPPRSRRCTRRCCARPEGRETVAVKVLQARHPPPLRARSSHLLCRRALRRAERAGERGGCSPSRSSRSCSGASRSRWICGSRPPPIRRWRRTSRRKPTSASPPSTGS